MSRGRCSTTRFHILAWLASPYSWASTFRWAMILVHGVSGCACLNSFETHPAASPMISTVRSTAYWTRSSAGNSTRLLPSTYVWALIAASSMSHRRAGSRWSGRMDHSFGGQDAVASEKVAQAPGVHQVYMPAKHALQLCRHVDQIEEAPLGVRGKRDQDVEVALGAEFVGQNRPEEREFRNASAAAEVSQCGTVYLDLQAHVLMLHRSVCRVKPLWAHNPG